MQIHNTKAVVLRTVKYGETSIIATMYTELFGLQSYIVKGVRKTNKKGGQVNYYQPGALLHLQAYHNELKHLQFIKETQWHYLFTDVFFNVMKNAVAMYMIELLQHTLKQPENNPDLYYAIEEALMQLDKNNETFAANLPLYFTLRLCTELGFQIQGSYSITTPVLDLHEGLFVKEEPQHVSSISGDLAHTTSKLANIHFYSELENIKLNQSLRRELLAAYQTYMKYHVAGFGELRSLKILQEIF